MRSVLQTQGLKKLFAQGFTLTVEDFQMFPGEIVAFLGANGSGKTTLFELLTGNADASAGEVWVEEQRMRPENFMLKRRVGYLPQTMHLPKWVTGYEMLSYAALLYSMTGARERVREAMEFWDCASFQTKPLASCSFGMQKRIGLALATLQDPQCLILDEPFSGLDLYHIHSLEEAIRKRQAEGKLTILSTHWIPYVVNSCQRVCVLREGSVREVSDWLALTLDLRQRTIEQHFFGSRGGT